MELFGDTWSPISSMRNSNHFFADVVRHKARVHQLYLIGLFLQGKVKNRVFVKFNSRYADYFHNTQITLEDTRYYWSLCMEWLTLGIYLPMIWHSGNLRKASFNINVKLSIYYKYVPFGTKKLFYLMFMAVCIGILLKLLKNGLWML